QTRATKERSSTVPRFASFPARLWARGGPVKGRDERPAGALDSPSPCQRGLVCLFLLDRADAFIDGLPFVQLNGSDCAHSRTCGGDQQTRFKAPVLAHVEDSRLYECFADPNGLTVQMALAEGRRRVTML